jgi:transcriptional regulator with XRE-family HTH domain
MPGGRPAKHERSPFGERLAALRLEKGLSQAQLAEKVGVTQQAYAGWERTTTALKPEHIASLADAFGISADELLGRTPTPKRGSGPAGRAHRAFEEVSALPRHQQQKIIETVEMLLAATHAKQAS